MRQVDVVVMRIVEYFLQFTFFRVFMRLSFRVYMLLSDIADIIAPDICLLSRVALFSRVYDVLFSRMYAASFFAWTYCIFSRLFLWRTPFLARFREEPLFSERKGVPHTLPQKRRTGCVSVISSVIFAKALPQKSAYLLLDIRLCFISHSFCDRST